MRRGIEEMSAEAKTKGSRSKKSGRRRRAREKPKERAREKPKERAREKPKEKVAPPVTVTAAPATVAGHASARATAARFSGVWAFALLATAALLGGTWCLTEPPGTTIPALATVRVVERYPHDTGAFTQGLLWHDGALYESTGRYGQSELRKVDLETGEVLRRHENDPEIFAEGLARVGNRLIQLSWREGKAFVYDLETFEVLEEFEYAGEGWGLCFDGERLVMSTGSDRLHFRDPETFEERSTVRVTRAGRPVRHLNELECVDGHVYANVWTTRNIARIDPASGEVVSWIDAAALLPVEDRVGGEDVLNGIAWLPDRQRFLLTGKNWPHAYEVEFEPVEPEETEPEG